ncbi:MAG TPA: hypothetical protein VEB20_19105 [Azospirillaceae bacterium]|nr:hypothetical protein [Azospirillaceae bacterium]
MLFGSRAHLSGATPGTDTPDLRNDASSGSSPPETSPEADTIPTPRRRPGWFDFLSVFLCIAVVGGACAYFFDEMPKERPTLDFVLLSGAAFLIMVVRALRELRRYRIIRERLAQALPQERLVAWRRALLDQGRGPEVAQALADHLASLAGRIRSHDAHDLIGGRVISMARLIRISSDDPPHAAPGLRALAMVPPEPRRVIDYTLVNLMLFSGIVGTFFGLILFLQDPTFRDFLKGFGSGSSPQGDDLLAILNGFAVAFGANLAAYIAYLGGRFLVDLCDDSFDSVQELLRSEICDPVVACLSSSRAQRFDLEPAAKRLLTDQAEQLRKQSEITSALLKEARGIAEQLHRTSTDLGGAITEAVGMSRALHAAFVEMRRNWADTTQQWSSATESFAISAGKAAVSVGDAADRLLSVQRDVTDRSATLVGNLDAAAERTAALLSSQATHLEEAFGKAAAQFTASVGKVAEQLSHAIELHAGCISETSDGLTRLGELQDRFVRSVASLSEALRNDRDLSSDAFRQLMGDYRRQLLALTEALEAQRAAHDDNGQMLRSLTRLVHGDEHPDTLLDVLRGLKGMLAVRSMVRPS